MTAPATARRRPPRPGCAAAGARHRPRGEPGRSTEVGTVETRDGGPCTVEAGAWRQRRRQARGGPRPSPEGQRHSHHHVQRPDEHVARRRGRGAPSRAASERARVRRPTWRRGVGRGSRSRYGRSVSRTLGAEILHPWENPVRPRTPNTRATVSSPTRAAHGLNDGQRPGRTDAARGGAGRATRETETGAGLTPTQLTHTT